MGALIIPKTCATAVPPAMIEALRANRLRGSILLISVLIGFDFDRSSSDGCRSRPGGRRTYSQGQLLAPFVGRNLDQRIDGPRGQQAAHQAGRNDREERVETGIKKRPEGKEYGKMDQVKAVRDLAEERGHSRGA